mmetsp:Transcript_22946/g.22273  ORF Transcript_22946/g.22273 Transcript_22946/m.22273 type:complete len:174 (+) Transcript_22946:1668-2189(+)
MNPSSLNQTDSFGIYLIYAPDSQRSTLSNVIGSIDSGVTLAFEESPEIAYLVEMGDTWETGQNGEMVVSIDTYGYQITKGSEIFLTIPGDFSIYNETISEQGCTAISGFTDDISCEFLQISEQDGHILAVRGGFASSDFDGGDLVAFNISDMRTPKISITSTSFELYIQDAYE